MEKNFKKEAKVVSWVLLGLLMLVPGLTKLFVSGVGGVTGMLTGMGFPAAAFFAWVLIIGEIGSGVAIFARWKLKYVVYIPMIILLVATFAVHWGNWSNVLLHLVAVSSYWLLGQKD
ncbi:MAG: DoxX family protein [Nanoarchaeota archaeon]|nr:DoxX family protein [Nanoarchaeota archaeon]